MDVHVQHRQQTPNVNVVPNKKTPGPAVTLALIDVRRIHVYMSMVALDGRESAGFTPCTEPKPTIRV